MGNINDNIRSKKLYKSGEVNEAYKDSNGDIVVPTKVAAELDAIDGITEIINDSGVFHVNKHLVKEIENMRLDIEELHGFIKDAFGKDASQAASQGAKGDTGAAGNRDQWSKRRYWTYRSSRSSWSKRSKRSSWK